MLLAAAKQDGFGLGPCKAEMMVVVPLQKGRSVLQGSTWSAWADMLAVD